MIGAARLDSFKVGSRHDSFPPIRAQVVSFLDHENHAFDLWRVFLLHGSFNIPDDADFRHAASLGRGQLVVDHHVYDRHKVRNQIRWRFGRAIITASQLVRKESHAVAVLIKGYRQFSRTCGTGASLIINKCTSSP